MDAPASTLPKLTAWLSALATSPDYAIAFAQAYEALGGSERDAWLSELEAEDAGAAAYWPLLAVESAPTRVTRIRSRLAPMASTDAGVASPMGDVRAPVVAYREGKDLLLVRPMYSAFVGPVRFAFGASGELLTAMALPLCDDVSFRASLSPDATDISVEEATLDIARGVVVSRRLGREIPELLVSHPELLEHRAVRAGGAS